ncbi:macrolide family glycosyltransferase [Clostridium manihotivorum]|uniref:Glycosyl transferase n=1 Tax=Clostridium manihotivorum TaxID=2320868 RepID=A0A3R5U7L3_9CLOT|nr:macrolide family glycosyltransferase [Clostridium manihotivorum]QAA30920.1 glycosyl transferase [Clostridium manihotivorum]
MSKVLFLNVRGHGHVNPTLGLVSELIKNGEEVIYYSYDEFKERIEKTGATYKELKADVFKRPNPGVTNKHKSIEQMLNLINTTLQSSESFIKDFLEEISDTHFDYMVYGASFPYGKIIAQILGIPSVSSFAIFATPKELIPDNKFDKGLLKDHPVMDTYNKFATNLKNTYGITIPSLIELFFNKGDLNIAYTSEYFVAHPEYYDDTFRFIGPPIYDRKEDLDFPFDKLEGKKVIYISLGTVFSAADLKVYDLFFEAFGNIDAVVVMTAYNVDTSNFSIPDNFIVKNYVPQSAILKYTNVAITHAGMNSTSDLIYNNVPFVAIPFGADQPYMASRAAELGAAIKLDVDKLSVEDLKKAVNKVLIDPSYYENIKKISQSFEHSGGYRKAAEEIFKFKQKLAV